MAKKRDISHFELLDWNFVKEDSRIYLHNFCWYPSRFIPIIPAHLIQALSRPNETVFDPFCGAGTTLIEAIKLGRNTVGIDLNPVACFIAKTKCKILLGQRLNVSKLREIRDYFSGFCRNDLFSQQYSKKIKVQIQNVPNFETQKDWYHPETLKMLAHIFQTIQQLPTGLTKDLCKIFFISILIPSSGYDLNKHYTYYADNVKPKSSKLLKNSYDFFVHKLDRFFSEHRSTKSNHLNFFQIYNQDARNLGRVIENKIDLILTSPPYLGVTDYITGFRLAYLWFDFFKNKEMDDLKRREIGARWRRHNKNKLEEYLLDMNAVLAEAERVLKNNGYMCLVLGEPKKYAKTINEYFLEFLSQNLKLEFIDSFGREINKKFFMPRNGSGVHTEEIMIFRKTRR